MSYQALARKWRPKFFSDVVGQKHILDALKNSLKKNKLHHSYLFSGIRGTGKTTVARLFAKGLSCERGITQNPCGSCMHCCEIDSGKFVDLIEIDAASRTKVEDIRDLLDNVQYASSKGRFKIYLIDEVHMLSNHSFNALLKTLEEPPVHVKFLLATTDFQKLPITVLSRCIQFHFMPLSSFEIFKRIKYILDLEKICNSDYACELISNFSDGSLRDALNITDQAIAIGDGSISKKIVSKILGVSGYNRSLDILDAIIASDAQKAMCIIEEIASFGVDWEKFLVELLSVLHQIALIQFSCFKQNAENRIFSSIESRLNDFSNLFSPEDLQLYYQIFLIGRKELSYAPEKRLGVEMTLLRAFAFCPKFFGEARSFSNRLDKKKIYIKKNDFNYKKIKNAIATKELMSINLDNQNVNDDCSISRNIKSFDLKLISEKKNTLVENLKNKSHLFPNKNFLFSEKNQFSTLRNKKMFSVPYEKTISSNFFLKKNHVERDNRLRNEDPINNFDEINIFSDKICTEFCSKFNKKDRFFYHNLEKIILNEVYKRDPWAFEISKLKIKSKEIINFALNSYKKKINEGEYFLYFRSEKWNLNTRFFCLGLEKILCNFYSKKIKLIIKKNNDCKMRTPLEWRKVIFKEKLMQAHESITMDKTIQNFCKLFKVEFDQNSIIPIR